MKKLKRRVTILVMCVMLLGMSVTAYAATNTHKCVYSALVDTKDLGTITAGTHVYIVGYKDGKAITASCTVHVDRKVYVYRCGCGSVKNVTSGKYRHDLCGQ